MGGYRQDIKDRLI
uniref:Uncharacterized protein n=1 Tax=Rhizophora mucronata TaxID=61149 RepID=A0A2P2NL19_RHIMU